MWRPRASFWQRLPDRRWRRSTLDWQLMQCEWFPMSWRSMLPKRSAYHWHDSFRRKRMTKQAPPGVWRLHKRVEMLRERRLLDRSSGARVDPQIAGRKPHHPPDWAV